MFFLWGCDFDDIRVFHPLKLLLKLNESFCIFVNPILLPPEFSLS